MPYQWDPRLGQLVWVDQNRDISGGILPESFWADQGGTGGGIQDRAPADQNAAAMRSTPTAAPAAPAPSSSSQSGTWRPDIGQVFGLMDGDYSPEDRAWYESLTPQQQKTVQTNLQAHGANQTAFDAIGAGGAAPDFADLRRQGVTSRQATVNGQLPQPRAQSAAPPAPDFDPLPQLQRNNDDWNYEVERENQSWYNNERDLNNQDWNNQLAWEQQTAGNIADLSGRRDFYNGSDRAALNDYVNTNNAALGTFNNRNQELFSTQVPMLTAAQWQSNPQDLRNQNQALGNFNDIYGGSLDYQSQAAQAYADPATISAQWDVYGQLQGAAGGSLDTISQAAQAYASAETVAEQKAALGHLKALANREGMSWDQLEEVMQEYKTLSNPEITDQERFILTEFQQRREDLERSAREARMSDMAARGLRSGAAESTAMQGAQQDLGRQAVLTELGAHANAISRADANRQMWGESAKFALSAEMQAAGMYYDAAGQLRSQEFDEAYSRGLAADQTAIANSNRRLQAMGMSANQINEMRNASFNEAYSRGVAADNASANNQATRLSGANSFANQANTMRSQNDAVGTFNTNQQNVVGMNNQSVMLQDLNRRQGVANDDLFGTTHVTGSNLGATNRTNETGWARDGDVFGAQQGLTNGTQSGRAAVNSQARATGQERREVFTTTAGQRATTRNNLAATDYVVKNGKQFPTTGGGQYRVGG